MQLDASPLLAAPIRVTADDAEVAAITRRLRAEPRAKVVAISNAKLRNILAMKPRAAHFDPTAEEWQRCCGDIVVFTCARRVLSS